MESELNTWTYFSQRPFFLIIRVTIQLCWFRLHDWTFIYRLDATLYISDCIFQIRGALGAGYCKNYLYFFLIVLLSFYFSSFAWIVPLLYSWFVHKQIVCVPVCTNKDNNNNLRRISIKLSENDVIGTGNKTVSWHWRCRTRSHFIKNNISAIIKQIWTKCFSPLYWNCRVNVCRPSFLHPRLLPPRHGSTPQTSHLWCESGRWPSNQYLLI